MPLSIRFFDKDGFKDLIQFIPQHEQDIKNQISDLGDQTVDKMKTVIHQNKVRPQAGEPTTLEDNIDVEHFNDGGWGVGDIERLNDKAKHWRAVNFGSSHMVGKKLPLGYFQPDPENGQPNDAYFRQGRWKTGGANFTAIVKRAIPAMNYIEKTIAFVKQKFSEIKMHR